MRSFLNKVIITFGISLLSGLVISWIFLPPPKDIGRFNFSISQANEMHCFTSNSFEKKSMHIYGEHIRGGRALINALCASSDIETQFSKITYTWALTDKRLEDKIRSLYWDLAFGRQELFKSTSGIEPSYVPIAEYDSYDAFLVSKSPIEVLSLKTLRIGLLANPDSKSGHIVPISYLRNLNLDLSDLQIQYFPTHASLRRALTDDKIDVIGSYWNIKDSNQYPTYKTLKIMDRLKGSQWFIRKDLYQSPSHCVYNRLLETLATLADDNYFKNIKLIGDCES